MRPPDRRPAPLDGPLPVASQRTEAVNRCLLAVVAEAWNRFPSGPEAPAGRLEGDDRQLFETVIGRLSADGFFWRAGGSIGLTLTAYGAIRAACRSDGHLARFLAEGDLPAEVAAPSSLVTAMIRAYIEVRRGPRG